MANNIETEIREEIQRNEDKGKFTIIFSDEVPSASCKDNNSLGDSVTVENGCQIILGNSQNEGEQSSEQTEMAKSKSKRCRGSYTKYSEEDKMAIGKLAAECGNAFAQKKYQFTKYPSLSESTVRSFKVIYLKELLKKRKDEKPEKKIRGKYQTYTEKDRAVIGKCAAEMGNATTLRQFKADFPGLSESTVRGFKNAYLKELDKLAISTSESLTSNNGSNLAVALEDGRIDHVADIRFLPRKKRGRPNKIPDNLEATILRYLQAIAEKEDKSLSYKTVIGITKGVIMTENRFLLSEFGGGLDIDKSWAQSFFRRYNINHQIIEASSQVVDSNEFINNSGFVDANERTEVINEDTNIVEADMQENFSNDCSLDVAPTMLMIVSNHGASKSDILEMAPTLENLPVIASVAHGQPSTRIINVKITGGEQSFITNV